LILRVEDFPTLD